MKKILLILFLLPIFTIAQDLPTIYTSLIEEEIYIDRDVWLENEIKEYAFHLLDDENLYDVCPDIIKYYKKYGRLSDKMYFKSLVECEYGDSWSWGVVPEYVSSELPLQKNNTYSRFNLGDRDPRTAWVEGENDYGIGEYIDMNIHNEGSMTMSILNGYQKSIKSWKDNSRVKTFKVYVNGEEIVYLHLEDRMGEQNISFSSLLSANFDNWDELELVIRLEIFDVYPGNKWSDVAISGISVFACYC